MKTTYLKQAFRGWPVNDSCNLLWVHLQLVFYSQKAQINQFSFNKSTIFSDLSAAYSTAIFPAHFKHVESVSP